jgi:uncharacterized OB-fold protein
VPAAKLRLPAVEGWFTIDDAPALIGSRCGRCGTFAFPREESYCRNPACESTEFDEVQLSRRGRIWSYTSARYQPPAPYMSKGPFEPFCIAAVELAEEQMVVMGQVADGIGIEDLYVGAEVELVVDTLYEDDEHQYLVWKWKPSVTAERSASPATTQSADRKGA